MEWLYKRRLIGTGLVIGGVILELVVISVLFNKHPILSIIGIVGFISIITGKYFQSI